MAKSMTGYGKAEAILENGKITIEFRSLNGKNADINIKSSLIPKDKELAIRKKIADSLQRGTIDMFVSWEANVAENAKKINQELALEYFSQIKELAAAMGKPNVGISDTGNVIETILRMPDVIDSRKQDIVTEENWPVVEKAIDEALAAINDFREKEGKILMADVTAKVESILASSREIEKYEKERTDAVRERILARFDELKLQPDQQRLEQEMIFYLEKLDINEERVRLRQHCAYYLETLNNDPLPGKKLGFIAQEMGREINTTGSKANHTEIQKHVTSMKDELEKIKEQSLNIL
ncbi:MAG: YicC family protein [Bacteroidales bacterium]|nr:YicC family protein [Bacteroidales bacterium]